MKSGRIANTERGHGRIRGAGDEVRGWVRGINVRDFLGTRLTPPPVSSLPTATSAASCWLCLLIGDKVQRSNQLVDLRYRVVPGHAAVLMPEDVRDGVLTHIGLSQPHSDRMPKIMHSQIGKVRILLAGLAAPGLPGSVM